MNDHELTLRQRFEEDCKSQGRLADLDFRKNKNGSYHNATTRHIFQGYQLLHNKLNSHARNPGNVDFVGGSYILAKLDDAGYPVTGRRPYRHNVLAKARTEVERLQLQDGKPFSIWRLIEIYPGKEEEQDAKDSDTVSE